VALFAAGCVVFVSCSTLELTEEIPVASTIHDTEFIGTAGSRVYLQRRQMPVLFEPEIIVYWTDVAGFPESPIATLESGRNPWPAPIAQDRPPALSGGTSDHR
jgi:hypothetical protein